MVRTTSIDSSKIITPPRLHLLFCSGLQTCPRHKYVDHTYTILPSFVPFSSVLLLRSSQLQIKSVFCPGGSKKSGYLHHSNHIASYLQRPTHIYTSRKNGLHNSRAAMLSLHCISARRTLSRSPRRERSGSKGTSD